MQVIVETVATKKAIDGVVAKLEDTARVLSRTRHTPTHVSSPNIPYEMLTISVAVDQVENVTAVMLPEIYGRAEGYLRVKPEIANIGR